MDIPLWCCSVAKLCLTLCNPMNCSMPGFAVHHQLPEFSQTHVHWVISNAIQPSHPLSPTSLLALSLSQHQGFFQWAGSLHHVAKILELQHQSFQLIFRVHFLYDWRRKLQPTPVFLPGESHGQRRTWWAIVHGITKSRTWLSDFHSLTPSRLTGLISLLSKGLSRFFSSTTIWKYQFFGAQPSLWSNSLIHTWLLEKP